MCEFSEGGDMGSDCSLDMESADLDVGETADLDTDFEMTDLEEDSMDLSDEMDDIGDIEEDIDVDVEEDVDSDLGLSEFDESDTADMTENMEEIPEDVVEDNGYSYSLDESGRVSEIEGDLTLQTGERDIQAQRNAGGEFRRDTDDGGHFIGNRLNGPGGDINLFAQDRNFNRGGYKSLENEWARELENGNDVHVKIDPVYQESVGRPHAIMAEYTVTDQNGHERTEYYSGTNENLRSDEFNIDDYDFEFPEEKENK